MLFGGIIRFYQRLYDEVEWRRDEIDFHMISEEDRTWLERPFRKVVAATICSCSRTKAPGPDGFSILQGFFKQHWCVVRDD